MKLSSERTKAGWFFFQAHLELVIDSFQALPRGTIAGISISNKERCFRIRVGEILIFLPFVSFDSHTSYRDGKMDATIKNGNVPAICKTVYFAGPENFRRVKETL